MRLQLDWLECQLLLQLRVGPEVVLLVDFSAGFVESSHRRMLDPGDNEGAFLVVSFAHQDAVLREEGIGICVFELFADDKVNRERLVLEVPESVFLLGQEAEDPLRFFHADYRIDMVHCYRSMRALCARMQLRPRVSLSVRKDLVAHDSEPNQVVINAALEHIKNIPGACLLVCIVLQPAIIIRYPRKLV